ncbi:MAG TPA: NAD-dependent epimerase/dehydratase family protein [Candidatus Dormibacteraeota bacterium]|nr:NAD-dependent epimerase/dehydratase family protein [Candidatus Dormibacteraeota bacterium]
MLSQSENSIADVTALELALSEPGESTVRALASLPGDILILGAGGKMGPTLARMAKRASDAAGTPRRIIAVSRFSSPRLPEKLQSWGIETISCDLLDSAVLAKLPSAPNIVYMAGMKFGTTGQQSLTWAMNSFLPGLVADRFRNSRIAAFSTGNVYGLSPVARGGSLETDELIPIGEYAISCLGRERIFEHFSRAANIKTSILRLNYATELRYGVLVDIAQRVHVGQPVSLSMGYLNAIWQADANNMSLQSLLHAASPPFVINIAGPEVLSVRSVAEDFAKRFGKSVQFEGMEAPDALLSNAQKAFQLFDKPLVSYEQMATWIVDWIERGGETLAKPTHFENRAGRF